MASHENLPFSRLHKAKFDAGNAIDRPLSPEGQGDIYWASDTQALSIANSAGTSWVSYDLSSVGGSQISNLDDILNVNVPSPSNNQVLTYNSFNGQWEAEDAQFVGSLADLSDVNITGISKGSLLVYNGFSVVDIGAGDDGQALFADSADSLGLEWRNIPTPDNFLTDDNGNVLSDDDGNVLYVDPT